MVAVWLVLIAVVLVTCFLIVGRIRTRPTQDTTTILDYPPKARGEEVRFVAPEPFSLKVCLVDFAAKQQCINAENEVRQEGVRPRRKRKLLPRSPNTIAFVDVETTGLTCDDRVVALAAILLDVPALEAGHAQWTFVHRLYNPRRTCHPLATRAHGYSDYFLRQQASFRDEGQEIDSFLRQADLIVAHNVRFDLPFINRELVRSNFTVLSAASYCTMTQYRRKCSGSAKLDDVIAELGLRRVGNKHGALEDAWLAMNVFLFLKGTELSFPYSLVSEEHRRPQNVRSAYLM